MFNELPDALSTKSPDSLENVLPAKRIRRPNPKSIDSVSIEDGLENEPEMVENAMVEELTQLEKILELGGSFLDGDYQRRD